MKLVPQTFYHRSPLFVAPELLGKILVRHLNGTTISGRIVEVEAYLGFADPAAHGYSGQTPRTASLFKAGGHAYIYTIHRYHCLDIVTETAGTPTSVLIRALEPFAGIELMQKFRHKENVRDLTTGPGKLTQALQITRELDGLDVTDPTAALQIFDDGYPVENIITTKRVGISKAKDQDYRFYLKDSRYISKK